MVGFELKPSLISSLPSRANTHRHKQTHRAKVKRKTNRCLTNWHANRPSDTQQKLLLVCEIFSRENHRRFFCTVLSPLRLRRLTGSNKSFLVSLRKDRLAKTKRKRTHIGWKKGFSPQSPLFTRKERWPHRFRSFPFSRSLRNESMASRCMMVLGPQNGMSDEIQQIKRMQQTETKRTRTRNGWKEGFSPHSPLSRGRNAAVSAVVDLRNSANDWPAASNSPAAF